jgi:hypothetical protein
MDLVAAATRLAVALPLGSVIGFERQPNQNMAGTCGLVFYSAMVGQGAGIILREGIIVHDLDAAATCGVLPWSERLPAAFPDPGRHRRRAGRAHQCVTQAIGQPAKLARAFNDQR